MLELNASDYKRVLDVLTPISLENVCQKEALECTIGTPPA